MFEYPSTSPTPPGSAATRPVSTPLPAFDNAALPLAALLDSGDGCVRLLYTGAAVAACGEILKSQRPSTCPVQNHHVLTFENLRAFIFI